MATNSVSKYFDGHSILVTGFTGFLGKVFVEKLLRSCPGVSKIYLLVRANKGCTAEQRFKDILKSPLFDLVRGPELLDKLVIVSGNIAEVELGLSKEDENILIENVSLVFHLAASVRFDDPLNQSVFTNLRGTHELVKLALKMKNLSMFVHSSTTYCQIDKAVVDERMYPPPEACDWKTLITAAENVDSAVLDALSLRILDEFPNTYTFTKRMAEQLLDDYKEKLKIVIVRPSVVLNMWREPIPGWVDNLSGPRAIWIAFLKGVVRVVPGGWNRSDDYIPCDTVANVLLVAAWSNETPTKENEIEVIHASAWNRKVITQQAVREAGTKKFEEVPLYPIMWYRWAINTPYWKLYFLLNLVLNVIPAVFVDLLCRMVRQRPFALRLQRKIQRGVNCLAYFADHTWEFKNNKLTTLHESFTHEDKKNFPIGDLHSLNIEEYFQNAYIGTKVHVFKESLSDLQKARKNLWRMYWLDRALKAVFLLLTVWVIKKLYI